MISRSREGAWIEIVPRGASNLKDMRRSREGAWIEIMSAAKRWQNGRSRSREGAWIEMKSDVTSPHRPHVAPARERGLKLMQMSQLLILERRSREGAWIEIRRCPAKKRPR